MTETKPKRGGWRPNSGRKPSHKPLSPLEYLVQTFNDPSVPPARRDAAARIAAPFMHPIARPATAKPPGMKEARQQRAELAAAEGDYATPDPPVASRPQLVVTDAEKAHQWLSGEARDKTNGG